LNIGTGVKTSVATLLKQVCQMVPGSDYFVRGATPGDQNCIYADTTRLRECLDMNLYTPLDVGMKKFVEWARGVPL
jgi:nucleoside-diphosphate-sugar epimerase